MPAPKTNTQVFGVLMIITQVILGVMNGVFIRPQKQFQQNISVLAVFEPFVIALLTVLGFGLIFSYNKKLVWSGIGFTFFILAFVVQLYPLINAFWIKTRMIGDNVHSVLTPKFAQDDKTYPYYLSRAATSSFYENHIVSAFKCAIAVAIAFSCVLGRVGILQCWVLTILGTVGYEENRVLCYRKFQYDDDLYGDPYGTMSIFVFGGFMGLAAALILTIRERKPESNTRTHELYTANIFSSAYALIGTLILVCTLPFLILNWFQAQPSKTQTASDVYLNYVPVLNVILSISGSVLATISLSLIFKGNIVIRYLVYGPVAGAIIGGASSYYTSNPVYAIVVGVTGGALQTIFMIFEQKWVKDKKPLTTISFSLFAIQGFIGCCFAVGWKQIIQGYSDGLPYAAFSEDSVQLLWYGLICAGMGSAFGLFTGIILLVLNTHQRKHHFHDRTYWTQEDGIWEVQEEEQGQATYLEGDEVKNQHAYL